MTEKQVKAKGINERASRLIEQAAQYQSPAVFDWCYQRIEYVRGMMLNRLYGNDDACEMLKEAREKARKMRAGLLASIRMYTR